MKKKSGASSVNFSGLFFFLSMQQNLCEIM